MNANIIGAKQYSSIKAPTRNISWYRAFRNARNANKPSFVAPSYPDLKPPRKQISWLKWLWNIKIPHETVGNRKYLIG